MFCEFRKIVVLEGREQGGSKTTQDRVRNLVASGSAVVCMGDGEKPAQQHAGCLLGWLLARVAKERSERRARNNTLVNWLHLGRSWSELHRSGRRGCKGRLKTQP